jgi:hypothetical protein
MATQEKWIRAQNRLYNILLGCATIANAVRIATPDILPFNTLTKSIAYFAGPSVVILWFSVAAGVADKTIALYGDGNYLVMTPAWKIILQVFWSYVLAIYSFAILYFDISVADPERAFNVPLTFLSALYFSVVAITTTGFGDITPKDDLIKLLVAGELLFGFFYTVLFFSIVAGLATRPRR